MPQLVQNGKVLETHPKRAHLLMRCFELGLVHTHGRKRNQLLPGVRVLGLDDPTALEEILVPTPLTTNSGRRDFDVDKLLTRNTVKRRYLP
jgi:hypothetical protein